MTALIERCTQITATDTEPAAWAAAIRRCACPPQGRHLGRHQGRRQGRARAAGGSRRRVRPRPHWAARLHAGATARPGVWRTVIGPSTLTMRRSRRDPTTWASRDTVPDGEYHTARHRFRSGHPGGGSPSHVAYMVVCFIAIVILVRGGTS